VENKFNKRGEKKRKIAAGKEAREKEKN